MVVGSRLKEVRLKKNITQEELGTQLGLSKGAISLYESEKRNPKLETIIELMYILGVSADYLLGSDVVVEIEESDPVRYQTLTNDEMFFINELRKDKLLYEMIINNPKRGIEIVRTRLK